MTDAPEPIIRNPENIERAIRLLSEVVGKMGYPSEVIYAESENALRVTTGRRDSGLLIGKQGQTLDAIQQIINLIINKGEEAYAPILVDIDGYRERQKRSVEDLARRTADEVVDEGIPITLRPMTPYERRLVHFALKDRNDVETVSYGEDPGRRVTVYPTAETEGTPLLNEEATSFLVATAAEMPKEDEEEFYVELIEEDDGDEEGEPTD